MGKEIQKQPQPQQQQQPATSYTVEQLVALNPYNPDILPDLENYVNEQVMTGSYSLDANLCLLRLYQFEPERMSIQIIARILIKALMAMPASDFSLCLFLIPERVQMEEQFKTLIVLSHYLETARFRQFWEEASKNRHILEAVPGFEEAVQSYAVHILSLTCQRVPRAVLAEAINIEGLALDKFLEQQVTECGWLLEKSSGKGQIIILPRNEFNHPELKKNTADSIQLEHITRIFPILG
ncbi:eukaryotic translation initiation factor 3 subunit K-like [Chenopodium quinoa]|uniref:eukaryotic translation initiation factor 3 subunit K-like n=1 Tax=Chenopodium quinoa TaxID=63459 RepID=UPI000B772813|nr:eukaryotic translation initiation factor 3 subunit K-like [Chenopodium quinoa]